MKLDLQGVHEDYGGMCIIRVVALSVSNLKPVGKAEPRRGSNNSEIVANRRAQVGLH